MWAAAKPCAPMCASSAPPMKTCRRWPRQGKFRADLLDRLAFDVITLPPLRERPEDIMPLAEHFAVRMAGELNLELFPGFTESRRTRAAGLPLAGQCAGAQKRRGTRGVQRWKTAKRKFPKSSLTPSSRPGGRADRGHRAPAAATFAVRTDRGLTTSSSTCRTWR